MKSALKKLATKGDGSKAKRFSLAGPGVHTFTASNCVQSMPSKKNLSTEHVSRVPSSSSSCGSSSSSSSSSCSRGSRCDGDGEGGGGGCANGSSEQCSFAASGVTSKPPLNQATRHRFKRTDSPRVLVDPPADGSKSENKPSRSFTTSSSSSNSSISGSSCRSSSDSSGSGCCSTSFSVPESEAHWLELPVLKPLINPGRLQALRLCTRDRVYDGGDATIVARPPSPVVQFKKMAPAVDQQLNNASSKSQQTLIGSTLIEANNCSSVDAPTIHGLKDEASSNWTADDSSYGGRSEPESTNSSRHAIYQYSFRVLETKANMRPFTDPTDRRVEAIARASDSEIQLDPEPIKATSSMRLRRITIRAPDPQSLEKCCRMFDDKFPQFYASGGLGPDGRCVSKVYDNTDENYISQSHNESS